MHYIQNNIKYFYTFCLIILFASWSSAQSIIVEGTVSGLGMQDLKMIKKLKKNVDFEGTLSNVYVEVKSKWGIKKVKTKLDGRFELAVNSHGIYDVKIYKKGYSTLSYSLKLGKKDLRGFNILLEKGSEVPQYVGEISYSRGKYSFKANAQGTIQSINKINQELAEKTIKISNAYRPPQQNEEAEEELGEEEIESPENPVETKEEKVNVSNINNKVR